MFVFFMASATTEIYAFWHPLSRRDALPIFGACPARRDRASVPRDDHNRHHRGDRLCRTPPRRTRSRAGQCRPRADPTAADGIALRDRSEEHTSELQSLMRTSYAVFFLQNKNTINP